ncbi:MAG: xanthine dehydrogenase family protein molybdopterin-binding subunit [Gammaproteobacteria bacterium]|nr:xanthine dehydrogenase family protein molybdopterin-binding subunit [Gammaproteobacteria bacterium]
MTGTVNFSRRRFLKASAVAGSGLIIGCYLPIGGRLAQALPTSTEAFSPNAFLRIAPDGTVTFVLHKSEMGQGVYTSLPMLIAEELEVDLSAVRVQFAPAHPDYYHTQWGPVQGTGGSTSVNSTWTQLRTAGATAREMLVSAAAEDWGVSAEDCEARSGHVIHPDGHDRLSYGALADRAAQMPVPENVLLKEPEEFRLIGRSAPRLDGPQKVNGSAVFGLDVALPGMQTAVVAHPPVFGARLKSVEAKAAESVPGVRHVLPIDGGVAVIADSFWAAKKGRDALQVAWDEGPNAELSSEALWRRYTHTAEEPGLVAREEGQALKTLQSAARHIEAVYQLPYLAHATMEPLNCVADVRRDGCDVWAGTQFQTLDQQAAARITGLAPEAVKIHTTFLGGGFGRRANPRSDFVSMAVETSKGIGKPVKLVWTREDDTRGGYYRPMHLSRLQAGLDAEGNLVAWTHRLVGESIMKGTPFEAFIKDGIDATSVEGAADMPYAVPHQLVDYHPIDNGVPVLWWRSVGHSYTAFAVEGFLDEVAVAGRRDPVELRLALLKEDPRQARVLQAAADKSGWGKPLPEGRGRGIALHKSFKSVVAQVAEVSVDNNGNPRVHRVTCAVDCGLAVDPDNIHAQMESSIVFGLSAALRGAITFEAGRVQQSNFHDYPLLRINEMPKVDVHILASDADLGGVGEPGTPPIAPAVCNALYAATGRRVRRLPIASELLRPS